MRKVKLLIFIIGLITSQKMVFADNPIIQTKFNADPAPMVYKDTVYLYTSHDEDDATVFHMLNWMLYTTTDMVNWTDHGIIAGVKEPYRTFTWADGHSAWAPQCIARNKKFYLYCPTIYKGKMAIGVAVSDSPYGPFTDVLGKPLVYRSNPGDYDPTVFIDDDGQAYMYWGGNGPCFYALLNEDMISISGDIHVASIDFTGTPPEASYTEGPWLWKKNNQYYLAWASRCCPEGIGYAMSESPTGPWKCMGTIMDPDFHSDGNHPGLIEYKGKSYVFGLDYELFFSIQGNREKLERRSICVAEMTYNMDGTINKVPWWGEGAPVISVPQVEHLNPYLRIEAECIAWSSGLKTERDNKTGMYVTDIDNGDYIKIKGVDFGSNGAGVFYASVASASDGGIIELHIDSVKGMEIGTLRVSNTGGWNNWALKTTAISNANGIHDLFLVFKGEKRKKLFNFDYWKFDKKKTSHDLVAISASVEKYKLDTITGMNTQFLNISAIYSDGTKNDVSKLVRVTYGNNKTVNISNGIITGIKYGLANIALSYGSKTDSLHILVKDYKSERTVKNISTSDSSLLMHNKGVINIIITAEYADGHTEIVTGDALYTSYDPEIIKVTAGMITALSVGKTLIKVSFKDSFGNVSGLSIPLEVINRNPYKRNEAEDFNEQLGLQAEPCYDKDDGENIGYIQNGDWIKFSSIDFGKGAYSFQARVASATNGGTIEIYTDSLTGKLVGSLIVKGTNGWQNWTTNSCNISGVSGIHDIYFKFTGSRGFLLNLNWWKFKTK
jgi:hypothetical protein